MITIIFAPPGVGKSSLCARFAAIEYLKSKIGIQKYDRVFCNFPVKYTYQFSKEDIGVFDFSGPDHVSTLVLYDEASIDFHARFFKEMNKTQISHFKLHRKFHEDWIIFSQSFDVDKVIRDLAPELRFLKKCPLLPYHIKSLRINKSMIVDKEQHDLMDGFDFDPWYLRPFTTKRYYLPFYWGNFDTYDAPALQQKDFVFYE